MARQLLHGPGQVSSRKKLSEIKDKFPGEVLTFEKGSNPADILASLQTVSMFDENKLIIIENPSDEFLKDFSLSASPFSLVLWFDKEIEAKKIPKNFEVLFFPEAKEASIFPLLDLLGNRNPKAFEELQKTRPNGSDTQYLFTMIFYLLRSLAVPPKNSPSFVKQKLTKQRANFTEREIINLYKLILESDYKIKMGLIEPRQAEFSVINKFLTSTNT